MQQLIEEMDESCKAAKEAAPLRDQSQRTNEIVVKILLQVVQCTYFVKEYCSERSFGVYGNSFEALNTVSRRPPRSQTRQGHYITR
jgi:hypothetical protein